MLMDIIGHEYPKRIIANIIKNNRISHAYLFLGKKGIGKKRFAVEFAKMLNCYNLDFNNVSSCEKCISCMDVNLNKHPDILIIEPYNDIIHIEQIREIRDKISLKSYYKNKICIIDEAEKMNVEASSALLKILEEPVGNVVFILIVSNVYSIIPTIKSRCQTIKFESLKDEEIIEYLKSKYNVSHEKEMYLVNMAEGSLGRVVYYIEQNILELRERVFDFFDNFGNKKSLIDLDTLRGERDDCEEELLDIFASIYRDILRCKFNKYLDSLINIDKKDKIVNYSNKYSVDSILNALSEINRIRVLLKSNINFELSLNSLLIGVV
jgi:DNA polymerase-3 subunit delta'